MSQHPNESNDPTPSENKPSEEEKSEEFKNFEKGMRGLFGLTPEEVEEVKKKVPWKDRDKQNS